MAPFAFRALPVFSARDATLDFEQLTFALNKGDLEVNEKGELKVLTAAGLTGAWTNPTAFSAKLEETTSLQYRTEGSKTSARLKGFAKTKEAIPANTALFTVTKPAEQVKEWGMDVSAGTVLLITIKTTGVTEAATEIPIAHFINFDGITFNLT